MSSEVRLPDSPTHPHEPKLVRSLNLIDIIMVGIASMIGSSIFVLTGPAIGSTFPVVLSATKLIDIIL
jgi:amino acid transporter